MQRFVWLVVCATACGGGDGVPTPPKIEAIEPGFGPQGGGVRVVLKGEGFLADGAAPNRVVIGGREAPLAGAVDDGTLEVVLPPAEAPGPVDVVVFNRNGIGSASGVFQYSEAPTVTSVSPDKVLYVSSETTMTLVGRGFVSENAGATQVLVDGSPALDVEVRSDTEIRFTAPPGVVLSTPTISVTNQRGTGELPNAFRYTPGPRGGLLLLSAGRDFGVFYDPVDGSQIPIQRAPDAASQFRTIAYDAQGNLWGADRLDNWGKLNLKTQVIEDPVRTDQPIGSVARVGEEWYAVTRRIAQRSFGRLDRATGKFTPIATGTISTMFGGVALAADANGMLYLVAPDPMQGTSRLQLVNPQTGALGAAVTLSGTSHITDLRFYAGTLYALDNTGALLSVNRNTGTTTVVLNVSQRMTAMEVLP